ncbi:hypothetical protein OBV_18120 [Oscillibacter valericigenes Sjm18-20]|nr:hypothetical protein OBV_18120 [Oscillibacter valericigenes Sjm18-20]
MLCVQNHPPVDYSLCNQTVTVYHKDGETYTQAVYTNAFLDFKKTQNIDKTGSREANSFLLVIPCSMQAVFVGDKVLLGVGAEVSTREAWAALMPATTPGLVVVGYVDTKYWRGRMVHVEAGG